MDYENHLEHFSLRWNNYNDNMKTGFHDLLRREDFVDVTIAAEGKLIQAHKMVLSICSPYFKNIFKANPCQHPVVFLKDVTHKELSGILQFMYLGEVSVQQEELGRFLKTAEALQIKGLTSEDGENKIVQPENSAGKDKKEQIKCNGSNKQKTRVLQVDLPEKTEPKKMKTNPVINGMTRVSGQIQEMEELEDTTFNHDDQESKILLKNDPPELDFYDIECDKTSLKEENSGISDYQLQDSNFDMSDEGTSSPDTGNNSAQDLNNLQVFSEVYKPVDGNQDVMEEYEVNTTTLDCKGELILNFEAHGSSNSPALTKNQGLCPICGRILQHKKNLQTHIVDQHSGIFGCWPCQICHKVCRTWSALRVHTNRHHMKLDAGTGHLSFLGVTQQTN